MLSPSAFKNKILQLPPVIKSKTGKASYTAFSLSGRILAFVRVNTNLQWKLDIDTLYKVYSTHSYINTATVKKHTGGRVNSPSIAILQAIGCIDENGYRI